MLQNHALITGCHDFVIVKAVSEMKKRSVEFAFPRGAPFNFPSVFPVDL